MELLPEFQDEYDNELKLYESNKNAIEDDWPDHYKKLALDFAQMHFYAAQLLNHKSDRISELKRRMHDVSDMD